MKETKEQASSKLTQHAFVYQPLDFKIYYPPFVKHDFLWINLTQSNCIVIALNNNGPTAKRKGESIHSNRQEPMPCHKKVMNSTELKCNKSLLPSLTGINIVSNHLKATLTQYNCGRMQLLHKLL